MDIGENIKIRRQAMGLSLRDLGENVGVTHTTISKYEKGLLTPNSQTIIAISKVLQISIPSLLRPRNSSIQLNPYAFRARKLTQKKENQINAETLDWLDRYLQIEKLSGNNSNFVMPEGFPVSISRIEESEIVARDLRHAWDLGTDPIDDLTSILEDKGIKIGLIEGIDKFDALYTTYDEYPIIVVKKSITKARQRFSIAHELGHCLIRVSEGIDEESVMHRFAGAFLVPDTSAFFELGENRHNLSFKELLLLKDKYGMSIAAWLHRAKDLKIIDDREYEKKVRIHASFGWKSKEPHDDSKIETPLYMNRLIFKCHAEGLISTSKAAELLNISIGEFCSINGVPNLEQSSAICN